jgi:phosphotransferase system enzyme I (PtsI)
MARRRRKRSGPTKAAIHLAQYVAARSFAWLFGAFPPEQNLRTADAVAHLYDPLHPAVISLIAGVAERANRANIPVAVCGEMAGDVDLTRLLIGLGLRQLSMHPAFLLEVKQRILKTQLSDISSMARRIARTRDPDRIRRLVERLNA